MERFLYPLDSGPNRFQRRFRFSRVRSIVLFRLFLLGWRFRWLDLDELGIECNGQFDGESVLELLPEPVRLGLAHDVTGLVAQFAQQIFQVDRQGAVVVLDDFSIGSAKVLNEEFLKFFRADRATGKCNGDRGARQAGKLNHDPVWGSAEQLNDRLAYTELVDPAFDDPAHTFHVVDRNVAAFNGPGDVYKVGAALQVQPQRQSQEGVIVAPDQSAAKGVYLQFRDRQQDRRKYDQYDDYAETPQ